MIEAREARVWEVTDRLVADFRSVAADRTVKPDSPVRISVECGVDEVVDHICNNPAQARGWLNDLLRGRPGSPGEQILERKTELVAMLAASELGQPDIDAEVLAAMLVGGALLWSVVSQRDHRSPSEASPRFAGEVKRLMADGALRVDAFESPASALA